MRVGTCDHCKRKEQLINKSDEWGDICADCYEHLGCDIHAPKIREPLTTHEWTPASTIVEESPQLHDGVRILEEDK